MIDGDYGSNAARTCDGHSFIDLGVNQVYTGGKLRFWFKDQAPAQAQAYSYAYSVDGTT